MSAIYTHDDEQRKEAEALIERETKQSARKILTVIQGATTFHDAEDYHQKYALRRHPELMHQLGLRTDAEVKDSSIAARINGFLNGGRSLAHFERESASLGLPSEVIDYLRDAIANAVRYC